MSGTQKLSGGEYFAALRLIHHVRAGKELELDISALVFTQGELLFGVLSISCMIS